MCEQALEISITLAVRRYNTSARKYKRIEGKNDHTTFLLLNTNIGVQIRSDKYKYNENKYLTEDQPRHVYKR